MFLSFVWNVQLDLIDVLDGIWDLMFLSTDAGYAKVSFLSFIIKISWEKSERKSFFEVFPVIRGLYKKQHLEN